MPLTPAQCRAARGLLDMTQLELAEEAVVGLSSVKRFESGERKTRAPQVAAIERVLVAHGVVLFSKQRIGGRRLDGVALPTKDDEDD